MKRILIILGLCVASARGASPSFDNFDTNYFRTNGYRIGIVTQAFQAAINGVTNGSGRTNWAVANVTNAGSASYSNGVDFITRIGGNGINNDLTNAQLHGTVTRALDRLLLPYATNSRVAVIGPFGELSNTAAITPAQLEGFPGDILARQIANQNTTNWAARTTNSFVASTSGAATNLNLWARANFFESGAQRWGAQWFDSRFDLTNTDLGGVYSFSSAGYLTAGGFNGDGSGLTNLTSTAGFAGQFIGSRFGDGTNTDFWNNENSAFSLRVISTNNTAQIDFSGRGFGGKNGNINLNPFGFVVSDRLQATLGFYGDGANLSGLDASALALNFVPPARLGTNSGTDGQVLSLTGDRTKWITPGGGAGSILTTNTPFADALLKTDGTSNYWSLNATGLTNVFWNDVNAGNKSLTNVSKGVFNSTVVVNGSLIVGNVNGIHLTNNSANGNIITFDGSLGDGVLKTINDSVPLGTSKQPGLMITGTNANSAGAEALLLAAGSVDGIRLGAAVQYPLNVYAANHTNTILDSIVVITPISANRTNFLPANAFDGTVFTCIKDPTFASTNGVWIHAQARTIYPAAANSLLTTNVGGGWQVVFASGAWYLLHNIP